MCTGDLLTTSANEQPYPAPESCTRIISKLILSLYLKSTKTRQIYTDNDRDSEGNGFTNALGMRIWDDVVI